MKKRILAAMLAAVMVVAVAAGCGKADSKGDAAEGTDSKEETRKVVLVTSGSGEPYSLLADDGTWTGIDAEMWAEIEKRTGWEVEVKRAAFDSIWGELDTARADVAANCWAVKPERTEKYYASIPYYGDAQCVIVPESNKDINTFDDLKGKKVGCTNGQAAQTIIEKMSGEIGFEVVLYEDSTVGMNDLNLGRIDAFANTTTNVNNFMHYNDTIKFRFLDEDLTANNVAYFIQKTDEGKELCDELNEVLQEMLDDGTVAKITEKWMFADMTQLIQK
ncbi:MAG: transporter substrate-binding domain-containing protein [bacterium]|nr:transporter substrate-binding domain-containing protein [bacterium]